MDGIWIIVAAALAVIVLIWSVTSCQKLRARQHAVREAFGAISHFLSRRAELALQLSQELRSCGIPDPELEALLSRRPTSLEAGWEKECSTLLCERITKIKNNGARRGVQTARLCLELETLKRDIEASTEYYNAVVSEYRTGLSSFPTSVLAKLLHISPEPAFEGANPDEKSVPALAPPETSSGTQD